MSDELIAAMQRTIALIDSDERDSDYSQSFFQSQRDDIRMIVAALAKREEMAEGYKQAATFLWGLLDDIDTAGDMAKADDKLYRAIVERHQRMRFNVGSTDGYSLELKTDAMLAAAKAQEVK